MERTVSVSWALFALLCVGLVLLIAPAGAQEGGIPPGTAARGVDTENNNRPPDMIVVSASGCTVAAGASITLEDGDGTRAIFTDGDRGITILSQDSHPRIEGPPGDFVGDHARFPGPESSFDTDGDYSVVSSTGVAGCRGGSAAGDDAGPAQDQYDPGDVSDPGDTVPNTSSDTQMPDTGGPPYLALGALLFLGSALLLGRGVLRS